MTEDQWKSWLRYPDGQNEMSEAQWNNLLGIEQHIPNEEYMEQRREFDAHREAVSERNEMVEMEL